MSHKFSRTDLLKIQDTIRERNRNWVHRATITDGYGTNLPFQNIQVDGDEWFKSVESLLIEPDDLTFILTAYDYFEDVLQELIELKSKESLRKIGL